MLQVVRSILCCFALSLLAVAQTVPPRTVTPAPPSQLDSYRTGFAPSIVYRVNRAKTSPTDWVALAGEAVVTSANGPDYTQGAGILVSTSGTQYKRVTALSRTFTAGDWLIYGVWVKASALGSPTAGATATMDRYAVATLSVYDSTNSFRLDSSTSNFKYLRTDSTANTRWQWVTGAAKVTSLPFGGAGELRFDLLCDQTHAVTFYAPTLQVIDAGTMTDTDILSSLLNLYPVPDGAAQGAIALLKNQKFYVPSISDGLTTQMVTVDASGRFAAQAIPGGGGGTVSSVFGRTGAVVAATNDYTWAQINKATSSLADITTRSASDLSSGTLEVARGGIGQDFSASTGALLVSSGTVSANATDGTGSVILGTHPSSITDVTTFTLDAPGAFTLGLVPGSTLTANRTLTLTTGDSSRTLTMGGNLTTGGSLTTAGNTFIGTGSDTVTLNTGGATNLTLPTTGTLVSTGVSNTYSTGAQDFGSATSLKTPTSAGAVPTASGNLAYDSTTNSLEFGMNGTNRILPVTFFTLQTAKYFDNSATETTLFDTNPTIPANWWDVGRTLEIKLRGLVTTAAAPPTVRIKVKLGSTVIADSGAITMTNISAQARTFEVAATLRCEATGNPGTFYSAGRFDYQTGSKTRDFIEILNQGAGVNTAANQTLSVTATFGTASASNSFEVQTGWVIGYAN